MVAGSTPATAEAGVGCLNRNKAEARTVAIAHENLSALTHQDDPTVGGDGAAYQSGAMPVSIFCQLAPSSGLRKTLPRMPKATSAPGLPVMPKKVPP